MQGLVACASEGLAKVEGSKLRSRHPIWFGLIRQNSYRIHIMSGAIFDIIFTQWRNFHRHILFIWWNNKIAIDCIDHRPKPKLIIIDVKPIGLRWCCKSNGGRDCNGSQPANELSSRGLDQFKLALKYRPNVALS